MQLMTSELLDCQGRVTHQLVMELDGSVTVVFVTSGTKALVDPAAGVVLTPGIRVPHEVMSAVRAMRVE